MMVERLARLPYTAEVALSMLVKPQLDGDWPRPLAVVENGRPGRFVAEGRARLVIEAVAEKRRGGRDRVDGADPAPLAYSRATSGPCAG